MKLIRLSSFVVITLSITVTASPLHATPDTFRNTNSNINSIFRTEPNWFDRGRAEFEQNIKWLLQQQNEPETPLLTIDGSA